MGAEKALAVSSATDAMQVGLAALGIGPGDEVITTAMTFCSTVHVIEHVGARPVLVDVAPDTLNIDPEPVAAVVTSRTRAIVPVHLYGHPCDLDPLLDIADKHGLKVVEEAAHALPARYKGRMVRIWGTSLNNQITTCFLYRREGRRRTDVRCPISDVRCHGYVNEVRA